MYAEYGFFREALVSLVKKGKDGAEQISAMMERFRTDTPSEIAGSKVIKMGDYKTGEIKDLISGKTTATGLPSSNVIQFYLEDGSKVTARPSGTEPKIKFYFSLNTEIEGKADFEAAKTRMDARIEELKAAFVNA
jgi:phosphoglucomutase